MNNEYSIPTDDVCVGDEIMFERATFTGSWRRPKFAGYEIVQGKILRDSYGALQQQHTFVIETLDGRIIRIRGRNLYRNGVMRKPWADESARDAVLAEKHARGVAARAKKAARRAMRDEVVAI